MARLTKLGDIFFSVVESETITNTAAATDFPVEDGTSIVDNVEITPYSVSLNGIMVGEDAADKLKKIREYMKNKTLLTYIGRNILNNTIIEMFDSTHDNTIKNGFKFSLTLKQIIVAELQVIYIDYTKIPRPKIKEETSEGKKQLEDKETPTQFNTLMEDLNSSLVS